MQDTFKNVSRYLRCDVLAWARSCNVYACNKVARHTCRLPPNPQPDDLVGARLCGRGGAFSSRSGEKVRADNDGSYNTLAGSSGNRGREVRLHTASIPRHVGGKIRHPQDRYHRQGSSVYFSAWSTSLVKLGVTVSTTTSYHPQVNGLVEQFHWSLKNALRCAVSGTASWT